MLVGGDVGDVGGVRLGDRRCSSSEGDVVRTGLVAAALFVGGRNCGTTVDGFVVVSGRTGDADAGRPPPPEGALLVFAGSPGACSDGGEEEGTCSDGRKEEEGTCSDGRKEEEGTCSDGRKEPPQGRG